MLCFKEASHKDTSNKWLVFTQDTWDAIYIGELSQEFLEEEFSFKSNKYVFADELEQIVSKLRELNKI